jgi:phage terminase large subunit
MTNLRFKATPLFQWNYGSRKRRVINQGGGRSGKTIAILQVLCFRAMEQPNQLITVTAEDHPKLVGGAMNDFAYADWAVIKKEPFKTWVGKPNLTDHIWPLVNGSRIQFKAFKDAEAATHGGRAHLFINEANHVPFGVAKQLMMRTSGQVFIDFNPTADFWAHEKYMADREKNDWFYSTYRDNPFAPIGMVEEIEAYRQESPEHYKVYGLGKRGNLSGQVFPAIQWIETFPEYADNQHYVVDFGYTNDPTFIGRVGKADGKMFAEELLYERGLNPRQLGDRMDELELSRRMPMVADAANPETIAYIRDEYGYNIFASKKPKVVESIEGMKRFTWCVTNNSTNLKKEFRNYIYKSDNNGLMNQPIDAWNHGIDGLRYGHEEINGHALLLPRLI